MKHPSEEKEKYIVIQDAVGCNYGSYLLQEVNRKIEEGYIPLGGIAISTNPDRWYQAMILKEEQG